MKAMNLRPAFLYRFKDLLKAAALSFAVYTGITIAFLIISGIFTTANNYFSLSFYSFASSITIFVFGICSIRDDLRFCIQHGVGRRTVFVSVSLSIACIAVIFAVAGETILAVMQALSSTRENIAIYDIYQLIFLDAAATMTLSQHLLSIVFNISCFILVGMAGMFVFLVFYRLSKIWTIIVAISVPVLLVFGVPLIPNGQLGASLANVLLQFFNWILSGTWAWVLFSIAAAIVFAVFNCLLMRRAPVTAAKR